MESKWLIVFCIVAYTFLLAGMASSEHQVNQCKIAYVQTGRSADEIIKICGK